MEDFNYKTWIQFHGHIADIRVGKINSPETPTRM